MHEYKVGGGYYEAQVMLLTYPAVTLQGLDAYWLTLPTRAPSQGQ